MRIKSIYFISRPTAPPFFFFQQTFTYITMQSPDGLYENKNLPFPKHLQSVKTKTDHAAFSCYFIVFFQQSYDEEVAASAQAWVDKCILAHGPPSTRSLNGIFLLYFQLHTCATNLKKKRPQCLKKIIGWRFRVTWPPMWLIASPNGTFSYLRAFVFWGEIWYH